MAVQLSNTMQRRGMVSVLGVEENTIALEVVFGESSSGASVVQGYFVSQGATRARMRGPYGDRNTSESREQTIETASRKIRNVATVMRISEVVQTAAIRLYTLALEHKFTKGRRNMNVVAVCPYVRLFGSDTERNWIQVSSKSHLVKQTTTKASGSNPFNDISSNEDANHPSGQPPPVKRGEKRRREEEAEEGYKENMAVADPNSPPTGVRRLRRRAAKVAGDEIEATPTNKVSLVAVEDSSDPRSPQLISSCDEHPDKGTTTAHALVDMSSESWSKRMK
ncbi:hypothetical protein ACEPAG_2670 [Sanghuangporus baumii]